MLFAKYIQKIDLIAKFMGSGATTTPTDSILLPAIVALTTTEYLRVGNDLVIKIPGDSMVIHDYFLHPVALKTEAGDILSVDKVIAMVNEHPQPILVAANDNVALQTAPDKIGKITSTVEGPITAQDATGKTRTLHQGDSVYLHDTIVTLARSYVKITLNDGTVLQLGPLSRCSLDKYSYDPGSSATGTFEASVFTGFFRYISGKISGDNQGQHTVITTPSANIGIRGSEIDAQVDQNGSTTVLHLAGLVSVSSRYRPGEEIVVYERGTTIYIPNDRASATIGTSTENQIQEKDHEWQIFNVVTPGIEVIMEPKSAPVNALPTVEKDAPKAETPREGPMSESHAPGPFSPDNHPERGPFDKGPFREEGPHNMPQDRPERPGPPPLEGRGEHGPMKPGELPEGPRPPMGERPNQPGNPTDNPQQMLPHEDDNGLPPPLAPNIPALPPLPLTPQLVNEVLDLTLKEDESATLPVPIGTTLTQLTQPTHGKVIDNGNGTLTYTPAPHFDGEDSFVVTLNNHHSVTVNLTITAVDHPPEANNAEETTLEDTTLILSQADLLQHVTEVDKEDKLSIVSVDPILVRDSSGNIVNDLTHGQVHLDEQGNIVYSPEPHFSGEAQFTYTVQDGEGALDTAQVIVTVTPVSHPPVVTPDHHLPPLAHDDAVLTTSAHDSFTIPARQLLANDSDPENNSLTITAVEDANNGSIRLDNSGNLVFTPDSEFVKQKVGNFTYQVSDGQGNTAEAIVTVTLNNSPPKANNDTITTDNVAPVTITASQLLTNDHDPDHDALRIDALHNGNNGSVAFDHQGNIVFTPDSNFNQQGFGDFTYQINDDNGNTATATVTVSLTNTNQPPIANPDTVTTDTLLPLTITASQLLANDSDPNGDSLKISNVSDGQNGSVKLDNQGNIIFTPDENFAKQEAGTFTYEVSDGKGGQTQAHVTVTGNLNQPPTAPDDSITTHELTPFTIMAAQLLNNDRDPDGDPLNISTVSNGQNGSVTLDNQGNLVFTPNSDFVKQGSGNFTYEVNDGHSHTASATVTVTLVNQPPIAQDDGPFNLGYKDSLVISKADLLKNDSDPDHDPLTFTLLPNSSVNGTVTLNQDGNVEFTRAPQFDGKGSFDYEMSDGHGGKAQAHVTVTGDINQPPIANPDTLSTHDLALTITPNQLLGNDTDPDGDKLTISNVSAGQNGSVKLDEQGNIVFTSDGSNFITDGKGSFSYEISDGHNHTDSATVTVKLTNLPPIAQDDGPFTLGYKESLVISKADLLNNDSDPDHDPLTFTLVPNSSVNGTVTLNKDGDIEFTRNPKFDGKGSFDYEISDGHGGKAQAHVTVTGEINHPPIAKDDQATTSKNQPVAISLLANDSDPDPQDTLTISQISKPANGTLSSPDNQGPVTFTPADNFVGKDSFTYTVQDSHGVTSTATVNLTVTNTPPQAVADQVSTFTDTPITIPTSQLLRNDTDADPGDQETLQVIKVDNAANGTLSLASGEITFTPTTGFVGETNFTYTIADRSGDQASALVTVAVNAKLQANDDTATTVKNTAVTLTPEELLANDVKSHPNEVLTIPIVNHPVHGTVVQDSTGIIFTPARDFTGQASFDYTATDGQGQNDSATVTVIVKPEPLVATEDKATTTINTPLTFPTPKVNLLANDTGDSLSIIDVTHATHGQVKLNGSQVEFTPERDFTGDASFDYTIQDSYGDKATATVNIAVQPINQPPLLILPNYNTPLVYKAGDQAQPIDSNASTSDPDSPDFDSGKLQVTITANRTREDLLEIQNTGPITVSNPSNGIVSFNGTPIGNLAILFATGALTVTLNAQATPEATTALLQAITYRNTATEPTTEPRTVSVTLSDGDGGTSAVVSRDIQVSVTNLPPKAEPDQVDRPFNSHTSISVTDLLANDTSPDSNDVLNLTQISHPSAGIDAKLVGNEVQLFIDGLVSRNFETASFDYTMSNSHGGEDTTTVTLTPTNVIHGQPDANGQLVGTADMDIILGNSNQDNIFAVSQGPDILLGGDGNDRFLFDPATATGVYIDGGKGTDTLSLNGASNKIIDLPKNDGLPAGQKFELHGMDVIDISGQSNQLRLSLKDVLDISDSGKLVINGDSTSIVTSSGQGWINQGTDASGYHHYTAPTGTGELLVSTEIAFQLVT